ncbi:MAG: MazG family protein [Actinomycetes bacterium]
MASPTDPPRVPGSRFLDLVAVQDRLRSPGGCPWDAAQTHESLVPYMLEESYECVEAIESGDRAHLREELGDLLMQVVFHARIAAENAVDPFTIDDVAADITDKLVRRHPHVFGDAEAATPAEVEANWEQLKAAEKGRGSVVEGIPIAQPALALADALSRRAERAGVPDDLYPSGDEVGSQLFRLARAARAQGLDPEAALRMAARDFRDRVVAWEETSR